MGGVDLDVTNKTKEQTMAMLPVIPLGTEWRVSNTGTAADWVMDDAFEPMGAFVKRVRYSIPNEKIIVLGLMVSLNGSLRRVFTEPARADTYFTPAPGQPNVEFQQNIPIAQRQYEFWVFSLA